MHTIKRKTVASVLAVGLAVSGVVTSCGTEETAAPKDFSSSERALSAADFTGPYAAQLFSIYSGTKSEAVAKMVSDSDLSRQDVKDTELLFSDCMAKYGFEIEFSADGSETMGFADGTPIDSGNVSQFNNDSLDKESICNQETSLKEVHDLSNALRTNPNKIDLISETVKCFIDKGLAPSGYTVDEYKYDNAQVDGAEHGWIKTLWNQPGGVRSSGDKSQSIPADPYDPASEAKLAVFAQCQNNPLNLSDWNK